MFVFLVIGLSIAISYSALAIAEDTTRINLLVRQAKATILHSLAEAEQHATEGLSLSEKLNYHKGWIECNNALADISITRGRYPQAEKLIYESIAKCEAVKDEKGLAKSYLLMCRLLLEKGDYSAVAEFNTKAEAIGVEINSREILANVYSSQGIIVSTKGDRTKALELFIQSANLFKELNDESMNGLALMRIGRTFELAGNYVKAHEYLFEALKAGERQNNLNLTGWSLLNIGVVYSRIDLRPIAMEYYEKALVIAEKGENLRLTLACLDNLGGSYSLRGDFEKADAYLLKAYALSKKAGHNSRTVFITGNLAENFLHRGKYDSAELFGLENLRIATNEKDAFEKRQAYNVLSQIYAAKKDYPKAYEMLNIYSTISDSTFSPEKSQQIEELREKYETEKKEQAIGRLTEEKAAAEFRRNTFATLSILLLVIGSLVFWILRLRVRRNRMLLLKGQEVDQMKSRFFANISHEFRTPLTLILGPIDDLISKPEHKPLQKYLLPMRKNASRLLELVNQLLELSRIESGTQKLKLSENNILLIVRGVTMSFSSLAESRNIDLRVQEGDVPEMVVFDRDKIEKVLYNLLSNAFKFTPPSGSVLVTLQRTSNSSAKECLEIIVTDTGAGINAEDIHHIFDRFYQANNNQLHQQDGSGIGLALTRELVEMHKGVITASSKPNEGTEIKFYIPLNLKEITGANISESLQPFSSERYHHTIAQLESESEIAHEAQSENTSDKPIVLIIEDHQDVRNYIYESLADEFSILEAADGAAGVELALERIPDLIVCDLMMPIMDGFQVCQRLKSEERTSHIPFIMLTAKADSDARIEGLELKADDFLTKPFVPRELKLRIHNQIESRQRLRDKYLQSYDLKPVEVAANSVDEQFLNRLLAVMEIEIANDHFGVVEMSEALSMSRSQLHRKLKALIGQGPNQFIRSFRLKRAHDLLKSNAATTAEIAYSVGFSSPSYFTKCFHEQFGYTPSDINKAATQKS